MTRESKSQVDLLQARAGAAQAAIASRHLRRIGKWVPGTRIGQVAWPPVGRPLSKERLTGSWNYWWQAHLVELLVDGAIHRDDPRCAADALALLRGIRIRNIGKWTNNYYDDMAWLGLAIERVERHLGPSLLSTRRRAVRKLSDRMYQAWSPELGGGIPWRTTDTFFNAPANGPAAILLARTRHEGRSVAMTDWLNRELSLPSGLIADGLWIRPGGNRELDTAVFTYCQGVGLGAAVEAHRITGADVYLEQIGTLLDAIDKHLIIDGVIKSAGGGDGGLFAGILARYLALVATDLRDGVADSLRARASQIVLTSAEAAWDHRATDPEGLPVFGHNWRLDAVVPDGTGTAARKFGGAVAASSIPERDLSVQISAGILLEAAVSVTNRSSEHTYSATLD
ncbi:MAG: glycoside hydrolase family 76 protein [Gordonia sp. (in: high G+C Gram-positive bacteria)]|uniref:glycoside hydrolase family 76 protein n=1 Tax=Gordonia sp. (in: high G+C Gram-positive bacteria) TaxID=84139 RepID=UPI003C76ED84